MNEVLSLFILLTEILMILQCLQIVFKQELPFDKYVVGIIAFDFVIYMGINLKIMPIICSCIFYALTYLFCLLKFKQTKMKTAIRMIIAFSLAGCVEGIVALIINFCCDLENTFPLLVLASPTALIITYVVKICIPSMKNIRIVDKRRGWGLIAFYGVSYAAVVIEYYANFRLVNLFFTLIFLFVGCIFVYLLKYNQAQIEIEKKNYELELQKVYGDVYEKLLAEVRKRQHDYKNQLSAIYSMHLTADSLESLISRQKEYIGTLQIKSKYDAILMGCGNQILAGYFYYKCIECEKKGVDVDYFISIEQGKCKLDIHELIEIFGILIDNACESVANNKNKKIKLKVHEGDDKFAFSISNPTPYVFNSEIERMFMLGYSTKGTNRGLGLPRAKELLEKYNIDIRVKNIKFNSENWLEFKVVLG